MRELYAICENVNCRTMFPAPNLFGGTGKVNMTNTRYGPCPNCGSYGLIPDGSYTIIDNIVADFSPFLSISIDKLRELEAAIIELKNKTTSQEQVIKRIEGIIPEASQAIIKTNGVNFKGWIDTLLAFITVLILIQQSFFKPKSEDDLKDKIIAELVKQNSAYKQQPKDTNVYKVNTSVSLKGKDRNKPCSCNSGKKFKNCCGKNNNLSLPK